MLKCKQQLSWAWIFFITLGPDVTPLYFSVREDVSATSEKSVYCGLPATCHMVRGTVVSAVPSWSTLLQSEILTHFWWYLKYWSASETGSLMYPEWIFTIPTFTIPTWARHARQTWLAYPWAATHWFQTGPFHNRLRAGGCFYILEINHITPELRLVEWAQILNNWIPYHSSIESI